MDIFETVIETFITALVSFATIKITLRNEIKKMKLQYSRDDDVAIKDSYSKMRAAVCHYLSCPNGIMQRDAQTALSNFIALAPITMQSFLQEMNKHLLKQVVNESEIETDLQIIDEAWQNYRTTRTR